MKSSDVFPPSYARYALAILFAVNLFNYVDRQIIFGVFPLVKDDLGLSDTELGWLGSAFMFLYMVASIPLGILGDRLARHRVIAVGVAVWGTATFLSGLAHSYAQLFLTRALVGIGEASYGPTATAMVSDLFPKARRGFVNGIFNAALPLGGAIGVTVGGVVGSYFGWRVAFLLVGVPSLVLALLAWRLGDPPRGGHDLVLDDGPAVAAVPALTFSWLLSGIVGLFRTPTFLMVCVVGMLVAFATGAFAAWLPTYLTRVKRFPLNEATAWYGAVSAGGGVLGVLSGGLVGDWLARRTPAGHLLTVGGGFILSAPFGLLFLLHDSARVFLPALFFAVFFLVLYVGSVNAVIHNVVHPSLRATAVAIFVLLIHCGGDFLSPAVIGLISDRRRSLQGAMLLLPVIIFFAGLIALAAASAVAADMRRVERGLAVVSSGRTPDE
jgi:MFS transporter, Spinster family, sphingosine-1-phosphate transporter